MYLGNSRAWIGVPASYYRSPHVPLEFRMPGAGPKIFQRPIVEVIRKPRKPVSLVQPRKPVSLVKPTSRKAISKPLELTFCPTPRTTRVIPYDPALGQWEAAAASIVSQIIPKVFGGDDQSKKAASMGRRSARAQKALALIYPFSNLIDNNRWNQLTQEFERMMQIGNGGRLNRIANLLIGGTPYNFAKQAHDIIMATSPASIIEKRGGQPAWTGLQAAVRTAFSQRKPEVPVSAPITPTFIREPAPTFIRQPVPTIRPLTPTVPYTTQYLPGYTPPQVTSPYITPYTPQRPQVITLPTPPTFYDESVPVKAGIDPQFLMWGGLGLLALIMMR